MWQKRETEKAEMLKKSGNGFEVRKEGRRGEGSDLLRLKRRELVLRSYALHNLSFKLGLKWIFIPVNYPLKLCENFGPWNIVKNQHLEMIFVIEFNECTVQATRPAIWGSLYFICCHQASSEMLSSFLNIYKAIWCLQTWTKRVEQSLNQDKNPSSRFVTFIVATKVHDVVVSLPATTSQKS